jgi:hypothetical protein
MRSKRFPLTLAALAALFTLGLGTPASAEVHSLYAVLTGNQEVPPVASSGTGNCWITLDDVTGAVTVSGSFTGLTSTATAAHIHGPAAPGMLGGILVTLTETGGTSGTISGGGTLSPANVAAMLAGNTYINVHTLNFGGGELRGQALLGVPSFSRGWLAALVVLGVAGGAFVLARRPAVVNG